MSETQPWFWRLVNRLMSWLVPTVKKKQGE
jgi:hypothetical protein